MLGRQERICPSYFLYLLGQVTALCVFFGQNCNQLILSVSPLFVGWHGLIANLGDFSERRAGMGN